MAIALQCNKSPQCVFQGMTPGYDGFLLNKAERAKLAALDIHNAEIIRPYLIGRELVSGDGRPKRHIIDADALNGLTLAQYPIISKHLQEKVLRAVREKLSYAKYEGSDMVKARTEHLNRWWTFWARRSELRKWMSSHNRIIAASRTQSWRFIFEFIDTAILPGDKLQLFGFDDDYSFGIIQASTHCLWYQAKGARLKNEVDYNYSSASIFDTFPGPNRRRKSRSTPWRKPVERCAA